MRSTLLTICFLTLALVTPRLANADFTMEVYASPAPNFLGSPSWNAYAANAINSLENGLGDISDRDLDPSAYEIFIDGEAVFPEELIVTGFASWRGVADPSAPFASENGNRLHFGLHIVGDGVTQFRMEDISFAITSGDGNALGSTGDLSGSNYSAVRVGIDYGTDRTKGTLDDALITSGSSTQFIDEFMYVGVGNAYDATSLPGATNQDKINNAINAIGASAIFDITGSYTLNDTSGSEIISGSTTILVVPEPAQALAFAIVGCTMMLRRRR